MNKTRTKVATMSTPKKSKPVVIASPMPTAKQSEVELDEMYYESNEELLS